MNLSTPPEQLGVAAQAPPAAPDEAARTKRHRRRLLAVVAALLAALLAGGAAGAFAGWLSARNTSESTETAAGIDALSDLFARVSKSVVDIETTTSTAKGAPTYAGSGFVFRSDGLIATNAHVVSHAATITVTFADSTKVRGVVRASSTSTDLALVQVPLTGLIPLDFADSSRVRIGDPVVAIGNALALAGGPSLSVGVVSGLDRSIPAEQATALTGLIQTTAGITSGDSGGPLVDLSGRVVGVDTAAVGTNDGTVVEDIGFAIPAGTAAYVLGDLANR